MSFSPNGKYHNPYGYNGIGSQIKWCKRQKGRKKCRLCYHYATEENWKREWHWYYLLKWHEIDRYWQAQAHYKRRHYNWNYKLYDIKPKNYGSTGLKESELKKLWLHGCPKKKCLCASLVQRAFWFCPDCWKTIESFSQMKRTEIHNVMLLDRSELKAEMLILKLSGIL